MLAEIQSRTAIWKITPLAVVGFLALAIAWTSLGWSAGFLVPIIAIPTLIWTYLRDETRRTTVLMYDLEPDAVEADERFHEGLAAMQAAYLDRRGVRSKR